MYKVVHSKGFTLLELIIVIIIIGVLATLGFVQYSLVIEKMRGAEARNVISTLRFQLVGQGYAASTFSGATMQSALGIGTLSNQIPSSCTATNYFTYSVDSSCSTTLCTFIATRCSSGGKNPAATSANTLQLVYTSAGVDTWSSTFGY